MTVSGTYDCQFVLVTKEIAALNAIPGSTGPRSRLSGSSPCRRCSRYSSTTERNEKASSAAA